MVKLYIYKSIYNKNDKEINAFLNSDIIKKYKLDTYKGFNEFINKEDIEKLEQFSFDDNKWATKLYISASSRALIHPLVSSVILINCLSSFCSR